MNMKSTSWLPLVLCALSSLPPLAHSLVLKATGGASVMNHLTATFGPQAGSYDVSAPLVKAMPFDGCAASLNSGPSQASATGAILFILRGNCTFVDKVRHAQAAGAVGVVVGDASNSYPPYVPMGVVPGVDTSDVRIPSVFIQRSDQVLLGNILSNGPVNATLNSNGEVSQDIEIPLSSNLQTIGLLLMVLPVLWCLVVGGYYVRKMYRERRNHSERVERSVHLPLVKYHSSGTTGVSRTCHNESCAICLDDFNENQDVKVLPCSHGFHPDCIDPWINTRSDQCPICKRSILEQQRPSSIWCCCR